MNNTSVDSYLRDGCGRCDKFQTVECKVHLWTEPLIAIREMLNATELTEHMKWGQPTYALDGSNVLMIVSRNDFCGISFFKGAALEAPEGVLIPPGPNSHYARYIKFTSLDELESRRAQTEQLIRAAIDAERAGVEIVVDQKEPMPVELEEFLAGDEGLQRAFDALTPGRQRSYRLYVGGAKKSETRSARAERCADKIFAGKGWNEY